MSESTSCRCDEAAEVIKVTLTTNCSVCWQGQTLVAALTQTTQRLISSLGHRQGSSEFTDSLHALPNTLSTLSPQQ